jgi:hypothetical protein
VPNLITSYKCRFIIYARIAANFPYLVDPYSAIQSYVHDESPDTFIQASLNDFDYSGIGQTVSQADACFVFANADSGEGYVACLCLKKGVDVPRFQVYHC